MSCNPYRVAVLTVSDKGYAGERTDESGPAICRIMEAGGYRVVATALLPDDRQALQTQLLAWCDKGEVDLILTTGGTGLSPRDVTPEATLAVAHRQAPGFAEAIRAHSMTITPRGMLSRGVSVLRERTLILNLPGSPKAVAEALDAVLPALGHGLETLRGSATDCAEG